MGESQLAGENPTAERGRESEGQMQAKLVCWGKESLVTEKRKRNQTDAKASLTTSHPQPMARQPLSNGLFWHTTTPQFYCWAWCSVTQKISWVTGGQLSWPWPLSPAHLSLLLGLCKPCSAIAKALLCYQHCFGLRSKTQHWSGCCY